VHVLAAHGRLSAAASRAARVKAMEEIVRPCAAALLAKATDRLTEQAAWRPS
jgi:hypothetical protein